MYLNQLWYERDPKYLIPFTWPYRAVVAARRWSYQLGWLPITHFDIPVIVVGNVTVGGCGKTPLVLWLVEFLKSQGYTPGIVSRGYGGKPGAIPVLVTPDSTAQVVGDEALVYARNSDCPLYICPDRVAAVDALLAEPVCDVVISDDGLQHYALERDIEILVIDGERRFGNGYCLPIGPLREPLKDVEDVDFRVCNGLGQGDEYSMRVVPDHVRDINDPKRMRSLDSLKEQTVHAVTGIGNPRRFFTMLAEQGMNVIEHAFPDHHQFVANELDFGKDAVVLMTEKDAVKCREFVTPNHWYVPIHVELSETFAHKLLRLLRSCR